ncbi:MBL fold metallo-hydrolase [Labrenzia sp. CE80]|uniref:MBL fold metallo-hydrolase n=1 Tax=Labrenzia sp. CE80 TaxID=1788986 RepID=UPI00129A87C2|nr:MBL fold metallo-hydrolase [Labrenzia sp. CE80]
MSEASTRLDRRGFLTGASTLAAGSALVAAGGLSVSSASASAPLAGQPMAGAIRRKVGSFEVTALLDGYLDIGSEQVLGHDEDIAKSLRKEAFVEGSGYRLPINAFLLNTGEKLVLVDAGSSDQMGPTLGRLGGALAAAGVAPEQIDAVLITHMHPDHLFGVLKPDGSKAFENAELLLPETDYRFWFDDAALNAAPDAFKPFFLGARKSADAYAANQTLFGSGKELLPGVTSVDLAGHTPGHVGFRVDSGDDGLFIIADAVHVSSLQFAQPDWGIAFDTDPAQAAKTRRKVLDEVSSDGHLVAGSHLPFPGFGHVARSGDGYRFAPADWQYSN